MNIASWNVNGIRACVRKGTFFDYLTEYEPDVLFLQEIKVDEASLDPSLIDPKGYASVWASAKRKGYSGVALLTRIKPRDVLTGFGIDRYDDEGRVVGAEYDRFFAFGVYFPNGQKDDERLQYKLDFYSDFFNYCADLKQQTGKEIIICGDYNTAHKPIDLARPKENESMSGFLPIERAWMDRIETEYDYVDTFRHFHSEPERYSWWTYRANARNRNVGWRIDYVWVTRSSLPYLKDAYILDQVKGSDHCPVGIHIDG